MTTKYTKVKNIAELKTLTKNKPGDFMITLNFGLFSRKVISYNTRTNKFEVYNSIDDTRQFLSTKQINDPLKTNIGKAIDMGALVYTT